MWRHWWLTRYTQARLSGKHSANWHPKWVRVAVAWWIPPTGRRGARRLPGTVDAQARATNRRRRRNPGCRSDRVGRRFPAPEPRTVARVGRLLRRPAAAQATLARVG